MNFAAKLSPTHFAKAMAATGVIAAGLSSAPAAVAQDASASKTATGNVTVTVTNLRNTKGVVRACMTPEPKRFPRCRGIAGAYSVIVPASQTLKLTFTNVKAGRYAIALLHDENDNGKADRALSMIPKEGFGFSRDAKVRMGPPKFRDAVFYFEGTSDTQTIRMRYML